MALRTFLAMTAAEIQGNPALPERIGWMACHFSPYGTGLSNLPSGLPERSLLILNDRVPIQGHDPAVICSQLEGVLDREGCAGLLLDFQRPDCRDTARLVRHLCGALTGTVAVSRQYAKESDGPVFLPPLPHHVPLAEYIAPWAGRELWLEAALDAERITLTKSGAEILSLSPFDIPEEGFAEQGLHCHYHAEVKQNSVIFRLWRTAADLESLLVEADGLGIGNTVGLYQELSRLRK